MIYIYKINIADENNPMLVDTWDGKFTISQKKMDHDEVINTFNNGYYFTSEKNQKKIIIKKSEIIKIVKKESIDKNREFEDQTVKDVKDWLMIQQDRLESELEKLYS